MTDQHDEDFTNAMTAEEVDKMRHRCRDNIARLTAQRAAGALPPVTLISRVRHMDSNSLAGRRETITLRNSARRAF
jgi:hypothetical protein